jgi:hypothetical protein
MQSTPTNESQKNVSFDKSHNALIIIANRNACKPKISKGILKNMEDSNIKTNHSMDNNHNLIAPNNLDHTFMVHIQIVKGNNGNTELTRL